METLNPNGTSLVWDYLFLNRQEKGLGSYEGEKNFSPTPTFTLHSFSKASATNVCLALIHLLKPYLNNTETFTQVSALTHHSF